MLTLQACQTQVNIRGDIKNLLVGASEAKPRVDKVMETITASAACQYLAKPPKSFVRVLEQIKVTYTSLPPFLFDFFCPSRYWGSHLALPLTLTLTLTRTP